MNYQDILESKYFNETYAKIEELKKDFCVNHSFIHINGVIKSAKYLADLFCLNFKQKELLLISASLHDIGYLMGRENHAKNGGLLAYEYLKDKMPAEDVKTICQAIANHGGKKEEDYICPVSMCLILADKFDFTKDRYKDDGKEHPDLPALQSVEKVELTKVDENNLKLNIHTTAKHLFCDLNENYYISKLFEVFAKLKRVNGYQVEVEFIDCKTSTFKN